MNETDQPVVRVHVASADVQLGGQAPAPARRRIGCRPSTVVLTSTTPVQTILDANPKRAYALVQAGGFDVVISNSKGEAENQANQVAGLPNPIGMVLSYGNTMPTKIPGGERWYAAAAQYPAQVTILAVLEED